jgi:hypothetical protein
MSPGNGVKDSTAGGLRLRVATSYPACLLGAKKKPPGAAASFYLEVTSMRTLKNPSNKSLPILGAARKYLARGWQPIPVPLGQKSPVLPGWQNLKLTEAVLPAHFSQACNIGVLLGEPSGWLIDIDLDHPLAARLAVVFLPATGAVFGRGSKPASHWLYTCPEARTAKWQHNGTMLLELRSTGTQTVFPPSIHPSGEVIQWAAGGEPAQVSKEELERACSKLAAATLLALSWPKEGTRQETALALAGALLRAGWNEEETEEFIQAVAEAGGNRYLHRREVGNKPCYRLAQACCPGG